MVTGGVGQGDSYGGYRGQLVEVLRRKGIRDLAVLRAVQMVPRHLFVPESVRHRAYDDVALPIGSGQTISQPFVQARYLELIGLTGKEKVLEIGTGSGYQTALLALLASMVFSVERVPHLAQQAKGVLAIRSLRRDPRVGSLAGRAGAIDRAACDWRTDGHSPGRSGDADAHPGRAGRPRDPNQHDW